MKAEPKSTVAVLGASNNPERYSYKAVELLKSNGFLAIPVHPSGITVCNCETKKSLSEITSAVDTLSIYVNPSLSSKETDSIIKLNPRRIIFNPGTENQELEEICGNKGIEVVNGCTLVMLRTSSF